VESELFGHRKGAFTGANESRIGRFQAASGGTLFLDELGNIPRHVQAKLLTALERREVVPVGANSATPIDVRVISATNVARRELADEATFRQDLLYRLNTVEIELPPLRERAEDIPVLADHFMRTYARKYGRPIRRLSPEAMAAIVAYPWPGNVRSLRHALERAVILCEGDTLRLGDFPLPRVDRGMAAADEAGRPATTLAEVERQTIAGALQRHAGNVSHAAKELGITRTSLYRRMDKYGF
jgi:DNA-binding NtrC family response regulator